MDNIVSEIVWMGFEIINLTYLTWRRSRRSSAEEWIEIWGEAVKSLRGYTILNMSAGLKIHLFLQIVYLLNMRCENVNTNNYENHIRII